MARTRKGLEDLLAEQVQPRKAELPVPVPDTTPHKFTMLNNAQDHARAVRLVDEIVARSGIRATKSMRADVVRALFAVAAEDANLREAVAAKLREGAG
jgi:hypothetical protein